MAPRNLNVWHGWELTTPTVAGGIQEFTVTGITPPPSGPVSARIGVVQADGDRGLGPDSLEISSPSHPTWLPFSTVDRPLASGEADWFNSTVNAFGQRRADADASPNLLANLNHDIALVEDDTVIGNEDSSASFRVRTAGTESLYSQVVHAAVELYAPTIGLTKAVDPAGPVDVGETVRWTLDVRNDGIDPIRGAVVSDPLPEGLDYVPGSLRFEAGGPAALLGPKTDSTGDDEASWDPGTRTLTFHVGAGATASSGGTMAVAPSDDGSDQLVISYATTVTAPAGETRDNRAFAYGLGRELDDPFGPLETEAEASAVIATRESADLGIVKTDGGAVVRAVGDRFTYDLTVTNAGPSDATGVVITDELDPRLAFASSASCTAARQTVTCPVGDLAVGETAARSFEVKVLELPGPGNEIPNVASVHGDLPDPDCVDPTPDALCNEDDESTPQPEIDLGITKGDRDAVVRAVGDRFTYDLEVTNAGPDDATAVVVTDVLDDHLAFASSPDCTAEGQAVRCELGDLVAGASRTTTIEVEVASLPDDGAAIPNVARVAATEPDPDCVEPTPDARCNEDDELTPQEPVVVSPTTTVPGRTPTTAPPAAPAEADLPYTGSRTVPAVALGTALLAAGSASLLVRRRRRLAA